MVNDKYVGKDIGIWHIDYLCDRKANDGHKIYHATCNSCGVEVEMIISCIKSAKKCTHKNNSTGIANISHTDWKSKRLAKILYGIIQRCYNKNEKSYKYYGEKGIQVCREWIEDFSTFQEWAYKNGYNDSLTIDRIDPTKNYCPENCRWVSGKYNSSYKKNTNLITVNGTTLSGRCWARELGLGVNRINKMIRLHGMEGTEKFIEQEIKNQRTCSCV